ncbi:sulfatase-like hydrolase/transferase [Streptomyces halobius]|uniref:Sulfatase-like hydrolase/transferase n=1 Tax=Streptomyces halobius TaxID=2879846 RepID=A0ABY4MGI8_9ACTN|nr:sulfatase-like hydrolase/transferase [Streptomyces halobius]UQA96919.1 sulfatase-like hydrolase/transferase [Streptomyces halobius]
MSTTPTGNTLFLTIDSCRVDTAASAMTPALDRLGPFVVAETAGTFTLPAHWAFFSGFLPKPLDGQQFLGRYQQLWSHACRAWKRSTYVVFESPTIVEHYARAGVFTAGLGGVPFFDPAMPSSVLPALFPHFRYRGERAGAPTTAIDPDLPTHRPLPTEQLEEFTNQLLRGEPFFGFVNFPETHFPYCTPSAGTLDDALVEALREMGRHIHRRAPLHGDSSLWEEGRLEAVRKLQVQALEWVDGHLADMFTALAGAARDTLVVVCADHGQSFAERGLVGHGNTTPEVLRVPLWVGRLGR